VILITGFMFFYISTETDFGGIAKSYNELRQCAEQSELNPCQITHYAASIAGKTVIQSPMTAESARELLSVSGEDKVGWVNFLIASISFPIYPHILSRYYIAKDVNTLKWGMQVLHMSPFIAAMPSIILGIVCIHSNLEITNDGELFGQVMTYLTEQGAFQYIMGSAIVAAAVAAYMSTADSGVLAISSIVTLDFVNPCVDWSDQALLRVGKMASIVTALICVSLVKWEVNLSDLFVLQGSLLFQALLAFVLGLYWKRATAKGMLYTTSLGVGTLVFFFILAQTTDANAWYNTTSPIIASLILQLTFVGFYYFVFRMEEDVYDPDDRPTFLKFDKLSVDFVGLDISAAGGPVKEPIRPLWLNFVTLACLWCSIPIWMDTTYENGAFIEDTGFPIYGAVALVFAVLTTAINMYQTAYFWDDAIDMGENDTMELAIADKSDPGRKSTANTDGSGPAAVEVDPSSAVEVTEAEPAADSKVSPGAEIPEKRLPENSAL